MLSGVAIALCFAAPAAAGTPIEALIPVQGVLRTAAGGPVPDGKYALLLKVYDGPAAGAAILYSQVDFGAAVEGGAFAVLLGQSDDGKGLPEKLFADHGAVWLGVTVAGEEELPLVAMRPTAYALRAVEADHAAAAIEAGHALTADKALAADTATQADNATTADQAKAAKQADHAEEATHAINADIAKALQCTGCVTIDHVDEAVLAAANHSALWQKQKTSVQGALNGADARLAVYEAALPVKNGNVGAGVADPQCALDVAAICQAGKPAWIVVEAKDAAEMNAITTAGAVAWRADAQVFYGRTASKWRPLAFAPECGDGFIEIAEDCDDGNDIDTDACTNKCKKATCGDGIIQAGVEDCDDGNNLDTDACPTTCKAAKCGDGFIFAGAETCDGNNVGAATCASEGKSGGNLTCAGDCKSFDTSGCANLDWMLTTDQCSGFRKSEYNAAISYAVGKSTTWDKAKVYTCPAGYHWASTAEGAAIFGNNGNTSGSYVYHNRCGWNGYTWAGGDRHTFRFSDSAQTNAYKHAGNYDMHKLQTSAATTNFAGIVCKKN